MKKWYFVSPFILQKLIWIPTRLILEVFGRLEIRGLENLKDIGTNVIFACNHASELDPFMIPASLGMFSRFSPIFYTSREKSFYKNSGWRQLFYGGAFFKAWGSYPVYTGLHDYQKSLPNQIRIVNDGGNVCIFPEGRKTVDGSIQPAKGGIAYLALMTGKPIVPVCIDGLFHMTFAQLVSGQRRLRISFGQPMHIAEALRSRPGAVPALEDFKRYASRVMDQIRALKEGNGAGLAWQLDPDLRPAVPTR